MIRKVELLPLEGYRAFRGPGKLGQPHRPPNPEKLAEHKLRLFAFHVAYDKLFAAEPDRNLRFMKALAYSVSRIRPGGLERWVREGGKRPKGKSKCATLKRLEGRGGE